MYLNEHIELLFMDILKTLYIKRKSKGFNVVDLIDLGIIYAASMESVILDALSFPGLPLGNKEDFFFIHDDSKELLYYEKGIECKFSEKIESRYYAKIESETKKLGRYELRTNIYDQESRKNIATYYKKFKLGFEGIIHEFHLEERVYRINYSILKDKYEIKEKNKTLFFDKWKDVALVKMESKGLELELKISFLKKLDFFLISYLFLQRLKNSDEIYVGLG